jgi:hypothetical protein
VISKKKKLLQYNWSILQTRDKCVPRVVNNNKASLLSSSRRSKEFAVHKLGSFLQSRTGKIGIKVTDGSLWVSEDYPCGIGQSLAECG